MPPKPGLVGLPVVVVDEEEVSLTSSYSSSYSSPFKALSLSAGLELEEEDSEEEAGVVPLVGKVGLENLPRRLGAPRVVLGLGVVLFESPAEGVANLGLSRNRFEPPLNLVGVLTGAGVVLEEEAVSYSYSTSYSSSSVDNFVGSTTAVLDWVADGFITAEEEDARPLGLNLELELAPVPLNPELEEPLAGGTNAAEDDLPLPPPATEEPRGANELLPLAPGDDPPDPEPLALVGVIEAPDGPAVLDDENLDLTPTAGLENLDPPRVLLAGSAGVGVVVPSPTGLSLEESPGFWNLLRDWKPLLEFEEGVAVTVGVTSSVLVTVIALEGRLLGWNPTAGRLLEANGVILGVNVFETPVNESRLPFRFLFCPNLFEDWSKIPFLGVVFSSTTSSSSCSFELELELLLVVVVSSSS